MDYDDSERPIPGPHQNDQHQNGIASSLQRQTHVAGDHSGQPATNRVCTINNQYGVKTFDQFQPVNIGLTIILTCVTQSSLTEILKKNPNRNKNKYLFEFQILIIISPANIPGTYGAQTYSN